MLFRTMFLLAVASLATSVAAARPEEHEHVTKGVHTPNPAFGEEGHTRSFIMAAAPTHPAGTIPHYIGKGVVAHIPADANLTWHDEHDGNLTKRGDPGCNGLDCQGVYICSQTNWRGTCKWVQSGGGKCHQYSYSRDSSFGIDMNLQCALFKGNQCLYDQYTALTWPGMSTLWGVQTWWGSSARSFKCRHCLGCMNFKAPEWIINFSTD